MDPHRKIDQRSLALHRLIAEKLRGNPSLLEIAKQNVARWLATCSEAGRPALLQWQDLLDGEFADVLRILESSTNEAQQMRQSSPFCRILTPAERTAIFRRFRR